MNTVSLDLAKKLHAIGYRGETTEPRYWAERNDGEWKLIRHPQDFGEDGWTGKRCNAYDATELLRDLPPMVKLVKKSIGTKYKVFFKSSSNASCMSDTPSEALGLLCLALHEKGII